MNEIEKMYKLSNIEPFIHYQPVKDYNFGGHNGYKYNEVKCYPPFTAEKQIELIKWLVHYIKLINITDAISGEFYFTAFGCIGDMKIEFEEALASLVNNLWQNLTEEEQAEIRNILKG